MVIEFSGMVNEFSGMVIEFRWIVIEIRRKLVKLQLISMNGHQNQEQIGRNNHLQTLFHTHSYVLSYRKKGSAKSNHLQTLYHTLQKTSSQAKPSQECEREKRTAKTLKICWTVISVLVV